MIWGLTTSDVGLTYKGATCKKLKSKDYWGGGGGGGAVSTLSPCPDCSQAPTTTAGKRYAVIRHSFNTGKRRTTFPVFPVDFSPFSPATIFFFFFVQVPRSLLRRDVSSVPVNAVSQTVPDQEDVSRYRLLFHIDAHSWPVQFSS